MIRNQERTYPSSFATIINYRRQIQVQAVYDCLGTIKIESRDKQQIHKYSLPVCVTWAELNVLRPTKLCVVEGVWTFEGI